MLASLLLLLRYYRAAHQASKPQPHICCVSVLFPNLVLVVCSPLLLLSGRTTGYFVGQSTAVVEILQSSAPGLVMVMMGGNAAAAVGAGDGRCCYWYRSASFLVVTSAPGQSASYSFAQSTDWFCS